MSAADGERIREALHPATERHLDQLDVFERVDSTNSYLLNEAAPGPKRFRAAIANEQTAGRGRRARSWISPLGSGLYLSLAYTFARPPAHLAPLTLALGVSVATTVRDAGVADVMLKWPNDIMLGDGKVGGILTESKASHGDSSITIVAGLGINIAFDAPLELETAAVQRAVDLRSAVESVPARDELAVLCIDSLYAGCERFASTGFSTFLAGWRQLDWLHGRAVMVEEVEEMRDGIAVGIDEDGALLIDTDSGRERLISGTIAAVGRDEDDR